MQTSELLKLVENELDARKAQYIVTLNVIGKTSITDYMVIATATSNRHAKAVCDHVIETIKKHGVQPLGNEGAQSDWMLLDLGDIVVHVMTAHAREFYQLEKLWSVDKARLQANA